MRESDCFVFPSIRELGASVVIEAMASRMELIATDYGAPGALCADGRGVCVPLQPLDGLTRDFRTAMEAIAAEPARRMAMARAGEAYARRLYTWAAKAAQTEAIYRAVLGGKDLAPFGNMPKWDLVPPWGYRSASEGVARPKQAQGRPEQDPKVEPGRPVLDVP